MPLVCNNTRPPWSDTFASHRGAASCTEILLTWFADVVCDIIGGVWCWWSIAHARTHASQLTWPKPRRGKGSPLPAIDCSFAFMTRQQASKPSSYTQHFSMLSALSYSLWVLSSACACLYQLSVTLATIACYHSIHVGRENQLVYLVYLHAERVSRMLSQCRMSCCKL